MALPYAICTGLTFNWHDLTSGTSADTRNILHNFDIPISEVPEPRRKPSEGWYVIIPQSHDDTESLKLFLDTSDDYAGRLPLTILYYPNLLLSAYNSDKHIHFLDHSTHRHKRK
jgi:hypothetical protein